MKPEKSDKYDGVRTNSAAQGKRQRRREISAPVEEKKTADSEKEEERFGVSGGEKDRGGVEVEENGADEGGKSSVD